MLLKFKLLLLTGMIFVLSSLSFAGSLPLNTGYDYSNYNTYSFGTNDNYWIRIASYPTMAVGPSWAVSTAGTSWATPLMGPTGVPSTWINAFGSTNASPGGSSAQNPAYAIYRKCFCLPEKFGEANIRGSVRSDESIQIWLNLMGNQVLPVSPINLNNPPYQINFTKQSAFRVGRNCIYVLVEDTGVHTGFNLAANVSAAGGTPMIAKGANMSFEPCACGNTKQLGAFQKKEDLEEREVLKEIVKTAEMRRIERIRQPPTNK